MTAADSHRGTSWLWVLIALTIACSNTPPSTNRDVPAAAPATASLLPLYEGAHDTSDCGGVSGWIRDVNHPDTRVNVDIFDETTQLGTVSAGQLRKDLTKLGDGKYGFRYTLPARVRDGKPHSIRVKIAGVGVDLRGTPKTLQCDGRVASFEGAIDTLNCDGANGWVWDKNHPEGPVKVDLYDGATLLETVSADKLRKDLLGAGMGTGLYGFSIPLLPRLKDGRPHSLRVRISGTTTDLAAAPPSVTCPSK